MKINNIVIAGVIQDDSNIKYQRNYDRPPYMKIYKTKDYTLVAFKKSRKCRIMGKKITQALPFKLCERRLQTMSASHNLKKCLNLRQISKCFKQLDHKVEYEPEIFPAIRLRTFDPVCVNLFSSGKVTLLGLKTEKQGHDIIKRVEEGVNFV